MHPKHANNLLFNFFSQWHFCCILRGRPLLISLVPHTQALVHNTNRRGITTIRGRWRQCAMGTSQSISRLSSLSAEHLLHWTIVQIGHLNGLISSVPFDCHCVAVHHCKVAVLTTRWNGEQINTIAIVVEWSSMAMSPMAMINGHPSVLPVPADRSPCVLSVSCNGIRHSVPRALNP